MLVMRMIVLSTAGVVDNGDSLCMRVGVSTMIVPMVMIMPLALIVDDHCSSCICAPVRTTRVIILMRVATSPEA